VSSTFSDLEAERSALQEKVFPKLKELCLQNGCRFQAIDLRWGVRKEAGYDQQTMKLCIEEIKRCQKTKLKPNFIVLLGDKYGWQPAPAEITSDEYQHIKKHLTMIECDLLDAWYLEDKNAVPATFCLQPRVGAYRESEEKWSLVENQLHTILAKGAKLLNLPEDAFAKYVASATEQEINQGLSEKDSEEHIFCFFRSLSGLAEKPHKDFIDLYENGLINEHAQTKICALKSRLKKRLPGNIKEYNDKWTGTEITRTHIEALCNDVETVLSEIIKREVALKNFDKFDSLALEMDAHEEFGEERSKFFVGRADILGKINDYLKSGDRHPLAVVGESGSGKTALMGRAISATKENANAKVVFRFIGATPSSTNGRSLLESICKQISKEYNVTDSEVHNEYAKLVEEFPKRLSLATGNKPLILFLDALDQLSDIDHARSLSWLPSTLPKNVKIIVSCLPGECLDILDKKLPSPNIVPLKKMTRSNGKVLLNHWLDSGGRCLQEDQAQEVLVKFEANGLPLYLKLAFEEARRWKSYAKRKELSPTIQGIILNMFGRLSSNENYGEKMFSRSMGYLAAAKNGLTEDELLDVLSLDKEFFDEFRKSSFKHELSGNRVPVVVWSRMYFDLEPYLTERSADGTSLLSFYHRQLYEAVVQKFLNEDIKTTRHAFLAQYFNGYFRGHPQPIQIQEKGKTIYNLRKLSELPYQETRGKLWSQLECTLTDLSFIGAKCAAGMTYELLSDYAVALGAMPEAQAEKEDELKRENRIKKYIKDLISFARAETSLEVVPSVQPWSLEKISGERERIVKIPTRLDQIRAFSQFVKFEMHNLVKFASTPGFCIQQSYNSADCGPVVQAAERVLSLHGNETFLLRLVGTRPKFTPNPNPIATLAQHTGRSVVLIASTPDGKLVLSGGRGDYLRVWNTASREIIRKFGVVTMDVEALSLTPDGTRLFTAESDRIRVWDVETGQCRNTFGGHSGKILTISSTPDGRFVVSGSEDRTIRLWNATTGECLNTLAGHTDYVTTLEVSSQGETAISGSYDKTVRVWDLKTGSCLSILEGHSDSVVDVAITPSGQKAISGSWDGTIRVWDIDDGMCSHILKGHKGKVSAVSLTPDGRFAVSGGEDAKIYFWDIDNGVCLRVFEGHITPISEVLITADGRHVISAGGNVNSDIREDYSLRIWDVEKGTPGIPIEFHTDQVNVLALTPDGLSALSGHGECDGKGDYALRIWSAKNGYCEDTLQGHLGEVTAIAILPDSTGVISGSLDGNVRVWNLKNVNCLRSLRGDCRQLSLVAVSADGKLVVSGGWGSKMRVWDLETGTCLNIFDEYADNGASLAISPDGRTIVSKKGVWDLMTGKLIIQFMETEAKKSVMAIAPDGRLAVSANEAYLYFWDLLKGYCLDALSLKTRTVSSIAFSPDGHYVILGTGNPWRLRAEGFYVVSTKSRTIHFSTNTDGLAVSPALDGRFVVASNRDKSIYLWNIATGKPDAVSIYPSDITCLAIKGEVIAAGDRNGNVHFSKLAVPYVAPLVCTIIRIFNYVKHRWDENLTAFCPKCGHRFKPADIVIDTIKKIMADISLQYPPLLMVSDDAWNKPLLLSKCPCCNVLLRFNPFIVDNKVGYLQNE
jgi:NACHT domain- and WD repeat-containing protein